MTNRSTARLAHFGDRIISLAVCQLVDEVWPDDDKGYFILAHRLPSNLNLASVDGLKRGAIREAGTKEEAKIGRVYFGQGVYAALETARALVRRTDVWREFEEWRADALAGKAGDL